MTSYRISTDAGWSKEYSLKKLEAKLNLGVIDENAICSADGGETTLLLWQVISNARTPPDSEYRNETPAPRRLSKLVRKAHATSSSAETELGLQQPLDESDSVDAVEVQPRVRELPVRMPSVVLPDLSNLYADAEQSLTDEDLEDLVEPGEIYAIPSSETSASDALTNSSSEDFAQSAVANAAARVLAREEESQNLVKTHDGVSDSPAEHRDSLGEEELTQDPPAFLLFRPGVSGVVLLAGLAASIFLAVWTAGTAAEEIVFRRFEAREASLMVLQNQSRIMKRQIATMTQTLAALDATLDPELMFRQRNVAEPFLPELEFRARELNAGQKEDEQALAERLAPFLRDRILAGETADGETAEAYAEVINQLVGYADTYGPDRTAALHRVSELAKLSFLVHRGLIESDSTESRAEGVAGLLVTTSRGLHLLYPELAVGDVSFQQLVETSGSAERAELLLIRYWNYRASRPETADRWLAAVRVLVEESDQAALDASVNEVDALLDRSN